MQPTENKPLIYLYEFDEFTVDLANFRVLKSDEPLKITPRAFEVLLYLVRNAGRVVGKQELFDNVWGESFVSDNALTRMVKEIRQVLGDNAESPTYIETIPKRGYRFLAPVSSVATQEASEIGAVFQRVSVEDEVIEIDDGRTDTEELLSARNPGHLLTVPPSASDVQKSYPTKLLPLASAGLLLLVTVGAVYYLVTRSSSSNALSSENISLQRLTNTDNLYWAMLSPNGQFVAYVLLHRDGQQSLHLLDISSRSEKMVVPPDNVSFYGGGFKPDSSELYFDTYRRGTTGAKSVLFQIPVLGDTPRKVKEGVAGPISFSPDGKRFTFDRLNPDTGLSQLVIANSADGGEEFVVSEGTYDVDFRAPNFSPDGKNILFVGGEKRDDGWYWHIAKIASEGGNREFVVEPLKQRLWGATWLGTGGDILVNAQAVDTRTNQLFVIARGTNQLSRLTNDLNSYSGISSTSDGTKIVVTHDQRMNDIWIWDREGAAPPRKLTSQSVIMHSCAWMLSGRILYNVLDNGKDLLWSVPAENGSPSPLTSAEIEGDFPDVSPDGRSVVFMSNRSGLWQVWMMNADGTNAKQVTPNSESPARARFVLGGSKLVVERRVQDKPILSLMDPNGGSAEDISLPYVGDWSTSADGSKVVYEFYDKDSDSYKTAVQSLDDRSRVVYLNITPMDFVALSPDGRSVLTKQREPEDDPVSTIWEFPVDGGPPKKLLSNPPDNIYWAEFSDDGKKLALVQGHVTSNLILFSISSK
jgi:DNA-binding winged helix-turn-helix (wHTH) protein/Tol biopolymer transport system component